MKICYFKSLWRTLTRTLTTIFRTLLIRSGVLGHSPPLATAPRSVGGGVPSFCHPLRYGGGSYTWTTSYRMQMIGGKKWWQGQAKLMLWVYGYLYPSQGLVDFLFALLERNWRRVQILVITDHNYPMGDIRYPREKICAFLNQPAPQLQRFNVSLVYMRDADSTSTSHITRLFGDDAPLIKEFQLRSRRLDGFSDLNASWITNLTSVTFNIVFDTEEVFKALQRMPRLLSMALDINPKAPDGHLPKVSLPTLRMLESQGDLAIAGTILQSIAPSLDCCLSFKSTDFSHFTYLTRRKSGKFPLGPYRELESDHEIERTYYRYEEVVKAYVEPYLYLHPPTVVELLHTSHDTLMLRNSVSPSQTCRYFRIECHAPFLRSHSLLKDLIAKPAYFSQVEKLYLTVWLSSFPSGPDIMSTFNVFSSITTLCTCDTILKELLKHAPHMSTLFPALVTLEIRNTSITKFVDRIPHHQYLKLLKAAGRPVAVLDFGRILLMPGSNNNMDYLEEHTGLLMKFWTDVGGAVEYICGSGHPETLQLCFPEAQIWKSLGWEGEAKLR
ncbi:hypothetical protein D9613_012613 [Agrocybe pediades]|uniref:Uncharacterized protein n=1 Tax=Agrocybe pediades TaxID=84607 RepID=A0A8H4VV89_9AGAR|nr:hypothetical protein D9613_012613 [Agrocybe pediades]